MSTQRISDKVAAQLRGLVQEQRLQPGDRLPAERTLAVQLGVSRTALREAIAQLASQGLADRTGWWRHLRGRARGTRAAGAG